MDRKKLDTLKHFVKFCKQELNIQSLPHISLINDKSFVEENRSFGEYNPSANSVRVVALNRNLADVCRSLAHELTHHRQWELGMIGPGAGGTGSEIENDANAMAGIIMREYGKLNLSVYDLDILSEVKHDKEELLRHYGGRYMFDVTAAYNLVGDNDIKEFNPELLRQFSHPIFSTVDSVKVKNLEKKIDYSRPLGLLVKFRNPEDNKTEWVLIDGNHRVRVAAEANKKAKLYVIANPDKVDQIMKVDTSIPHSMFPDDDIE